MGRYKSKNEIIKDLPNLYSIDSKSGCWNWKSGLNSYRSPVIRVRINKKLEMFIVRRLIWEITYPDQNISGLEIWNKCGNNICVNPEHQMVNTPESRFWFNVSIFDGCWEWVGDIDERGRGRLKVGDRMEKAYRYSWILHNGEIPEGMCVCHHCDNPNCVNPNHLFLGTQKDNMIDMTLKGRAHRISNGKQPLTEDDIILIRKRKRLGEKVKVLSAEFDVCKTTIYNIINRNHWSWVESHNF